MVLLSPGLTLGVLCEAPCFPSLLQRMAMPEAIGFGGPSGSAASDSSEVELTRCYELCAAALELEPVEDVYARAEPPHLAAAAAQGGGGAAGGGSAAVAGGGGLSQAERKRRLLIGQRMPHVPGAVLLTLVRVCTRALEPIAATAQREAAKDPAGWQPAGEGVYGDDDEDEEDEAGGAIATLSGTLMRKSAALLAPHAAAPPAGQALFDPSAAGGGMASPTVDGEELAGAMLSLLHHLVNCSGHRSRALCEPLLDTDFWQPVLRAAEHWPQRPMRDSLLQSLAAALSARASYPSDYTLSEMGPPSADLEEYAEFRDVHLSEPFAQLARQEPAALATEAARLLAPALAPTSNAAELAAVPWQRREAALFAATASAEVLLSRVLPIPPLPQPGVPPPPPPPPSPLGQCLPPLLSGALADFSPLRSCGAAAAAWPGEALLLRARCRLVGALAPWLSHALGRDHLDAALGGVLPVLSHPHPMAAEAAGLCLAQLSQRCAEEIAISPPRVQAAFGALGVPTPALDAERRCVLVASVARLAVAAPEASRGALVEGLLGPLISTLQQAVTALETTARSGGDVAPAAAQLAQRLDEVGAGIKAVRPLGQPAIASLLAHVWPAWVAAAGACRLAPTPLLASLSACGRVCICGAGLDGRPLLPQTVSALTGALSATPAAGVPLFGLADAVFETFSPAPGMEASFASLLDQLTAHALPLLSSPSADDDRLELAAGLLSHADKVARLQPAAIAQAQSLPSLVALATSLLGACRKEGAAGVDPAVEFLGAVAVQARTHRASAQAAGQAAGQAADPETVRARLEQAMSGAAGEALVRAAVVGLSDSLPLPAVPRIASILAPLLYLPSWRPQLAAWTQAALAGLPMVDGVPDNRTRETLLTVLSTMPDPLTSGQSFHLGLLEALRKALGDFAAVCRRMQSASAFDVACYDWSKINK